MTKILKFIPDTILKSLYGKYYNIPGIYASRTNKSAFTAKHAFPDIPFDSLILSSFKKNIHFPETESGKFTGGTGGSAASTFNTQTESRFFAENVFSYTPVV